MKKILTTLHRYGKKTGDDTIDFLIYLPHSSLDTDWLSFARSTFQIPRDDISDALLGSYMYHEADIGMSEVTQSCMASLVDIDFSIGILEVNIPRSLCDLNRPLELAVPPIMNTEKWGNIYSDATIEISEVLSRSKFCLQLHSMCSYDRIQSFQFDSSVSVSQIYDFVSSGYAGNKRECTILTSDTNGNHKSNHTYDELLTRSFNRDNISIGKNTAYQLIWDYPATKIMETIPSSFLEITKWSLANTDTSDMIDTNQIIFDADKISIFGNILARSIEQFLIRN